MSAGPVVRVGLVGLGEVGRLHLEAYRALPEVRVEGVADPQPTRLEGLAADNGIQAFGDYRDMLAQVPLDIVCVLTPASTHEQVVEDCARAGRHVLCEKPLSTSVESARRMMAACNAAGVSLCYGASYRYLPALREARRLITAGAIGKVLLLRESIVGGSGPQGRRPLSPVHYPVDGPGGSGLGLVDHGIHLIDAFSWLVEDRVEWAFGRGNRTGQAASTEYLLMGFSRGAVGQLIYDDGTFSADLPHEGRFSAGAGWDFAGPVPPGGWQPHPQSIAVHGSQGALRVFHYANALYLIDDRGAREIPLDRPPPPAHFASQLAQFIDDIAADRPPSVGAEAGLVALQVLTSAYESFERLAAARIGGAFAHE